jgi:hypothetical protein
MTTHVDNLDLITQTINTQYDLARIELFRPLEHFDRFHGIKASEMGHDCHPTYSSKGNGELAASQLQWEHLGARLEPIRDIAQAIALTHDVTPTLDVRENIATCGCPPSKRRGGAVAHYSVRVSIVWNGRTLMREYLLPEVKP